MANRRFIDFPIASTVGDNDIVLIWQDGLNKQTTKGTLIQGAPTTLEGLTDVDIAGLINGQILQYNSVTGKWENVDRAGLNLSELGDVSIVSPSNGQVLVYNSTTSKWENSSGGYVPYNGAVTTVDLGAQGLRAGYIRFDTSVVSVPNEQGLMYWDDSRSTAALIMNGTLQHIGQDTFFYVKNSTGSSIAKGTAVRFDGTDGASGHLKIAPFLANGTYPSTYFMGVTAETIGNGSFGQVMHFGELSGINTSGYTAGALLYASTTVAGGFQTTAPVAPNNIVLIAAAINSKNNGDIIVRPTYGSNINQDEGVKITTPTTGQLLQLQSNGLWENKTKAQVLGGTSSQFVKGDGSLDSTTYQSTAEKGQPNGYASLDGNGKVPLAQINDALIGNVNYQGLWNASTNTPTLANPPSSGTKGYYYIVSTAGTFAGISFEVGDWIISNGSAWQKVDNTDAVSSVFGRTGNVVAANGDYTTAQVTESGNLYYTEARVNANTNVAANTAARHNAVTLGTANGLSLSTQVLSLGLASAGVTGALSGTDWSTFNSKQQALNGTGFVKASGTTISYDNTSYLPLTGGIITGNLTVNGIYYVPASSFFISGVNGFRFNNSADTFNNFIIYDNGNTLTRGEATFSNLAGSGTRMVVANSSGLLSTQAIPLGTVTSVTASSPLFSSGGTTPNITIQQASGSQNGFLSSTDWTTFNNKQNALTNPVTGTGTTNYLPKFTGTSTIGNSLIFDNGTNVGIGTNNPTIFGGGLEVSRAGQAGVRVSSTGSGGGGIEIGNANGTGGFIQTCQTGGIITFITDNASKTAMTIFSDGNTFIGSSPSNAGFKLDVNGTGRFSDRLNVTKDDITSIIVANFDTVNRMEMSANGFNLVGGNPFYIKQAGGSNQFTVTVNGNVLIGTTNDNGNKLRVNGDLWVDGVYRVPVSSYFICGSAGYRFNSSDDAFNNFIIYDNGNTYSRGNVLIGTTTTIGPAAGKVDILYSGLVQYGMNIRSTHTDGIAISFVNSSGTQVGTIYQNSSSTAYNTSSDYRLKTDLKDFNGVEIINKIKTYDFEWKTDNTRSYGVIAHELKEVIDYAVYGEKDSVTMQGVDYSKLVPIMVKAIQELKQEINTLKN